MPHNIKSSFERWKSPETMRQVMDQIPVMWASLKVHCPSKSSDIYSLWLFCFAQFIQSPHPFTWRLPFWDQSGGWPHFLHWLSTLRNLGEAIKDTTPETLPTTWIIFRAWTFGWVGMLLNPWPVPQTRRECWGSKVLPCFYGTTEILPHFSHNRK